MSDSHEDDDMPEEARVVGPILLNQEMAIKIAGLAQHAANKFVMLTQEVPTDRTSPQVLPIRLARNHSRSEHLEWWEITMGYGSAEARLLEQEELDEP